MVVDVTAVVIKAVVGVVLLFLLTVGGVLGFFYVNATSSVTAPYATVGFVLFAIIGVAVLGFELNWTTSLETRASEGSD